MAMPYDAERVMQLRGMLQEARKRKLSAGLRERREKGRQISSQYGTIFRRCRLSQMAVARASARHRLDIDPKDAFSYVSRARSFDAKGDHDRALADFDKAIEINPSYANRLFSRGVSHESNNEGDLAPHLRG